MACFISCIVNGICPCALLFFVFLSFIYLPKKLKKFSSEAIEEVYKFPLVAWDIVCTLVVLGLRKLGPLIKPLWGKW